MRNKDYRELQISSSVLIFIFIGIIIVGIIIFLLGVSVGKKQAQVAGSQAVPAKPFEDVVAEKPKPAADTDEIKQEIAGHEVAQKQEEQKKPTEVVTKPKIKSTPPVSKKSTSTQKSVPPPSSGRFFLQVGAFSSQESADSVVEKYQSMGFSTQIIAPGAGDRRQLYRVVIGGFGTRAEAEQAKSRLVETEGQKARDYFIVQR